MPSQESPYKFFTILALGLGTFALYKFLKISAASKSTPATSSASATKKPLSRQELVEKFGRSPAIVQDEDTGEYFVQDAHNPDNVTPISAEEIQILTGGQVQPEEQQQAETEEPQDRDAPAPVANFAPGVIAGGILGPEDFEDFQEDIEDAELDALNQGLADEEEFRMHQQQAGFGNGAGPGPATARNNANRTVGAKKAKSLERKDQKRAYNEYVREMSLMRKAEEEEHMKQFGDLIQMERDERNRRNEEVEAERKERLRKQKEEEEAAQAAKEESRRRLQELEPGEIHGINSTDEISIAHGLSDAFVVDNDSFVIKLSEQDIDSFSQALKDKGSLSFEEMAEILTQLKA